MRGPYLKYCGLPGSVEYAREDYIESCRRESFKTYIVHLPEIYFVKAHFNIILLRRLCVSGDSLSTVFPITMQCHEKCFDCAL
jgi:hypothetical protein